MVIALAWVLLASWAAFVFAGSFAPQSFGASLQESGVVFLLLLAWVGLVTYLAIRRRFSWNPVAMALVAGLLVWNPAGPAIHAWGFRVAQPALEAALISGECPEHAGPYRIGHCTSLEGHRLFILADTGFVTIGLAKVPESEAQRLRLQWPMSAESGGWYVIRYDF